MNFASSHAYLGAEEEAELDDDVLQAVEASGGLLNAVSMAQQQQQMMMSPMLAQAGLMDDDEPAPAAAAPGAPRREREQRRRSSRNSASSADSSADDDGDAEMRDERAPAQPKSKAKKGGAGFFSRLFGGAASSSSSNVGRSAPPPPRPSMQQQQQQQQSAGFLNFLNNKRSAPPAPAAPGAAMGFGSAPPAGSSSASAAGASAPRNKRSYKRAVDTNIVVIKHSTLAQSADEIFAGDVVVCQGEGCGAALSQLSTLLDHQGKVVPRANAPAAAEQAAPGGLPVVPEASEPASAAAASSASSSSAAAASSSGSSARGLLPPDVVVEPGQMCFVCDFCSHANVIDELAQAEIPTTASRDYVIEPAPVVDGGNNGSGPSDDQSLVVFVLDISGSMCVSAPVPGHIELRGQRAIDPALLALDDVDMRGVGSRNVTYVSRLQAVQASIDTQLAALAKTHPQRRCVLITFNGEVTIFGDGAAGAQQVIAGDRLQSEAELTLVGRQYAGAGRIRPVSQSRESLGAALFTLEETGPTALGPALVAAIAMAGTARGSSVVVCTDGLANVGLGSMTEKNVSRDELEAWYSRQGQLARDAGVTVSVVSIKGDECRLEALGLVAAESGGRVDRLDPLEMINNGAALLVKPPIATNVSVTFFLHKGMQFRNEDDAAGQQQQQAAGAGPAGPAGPCNKLTRVVGNVTLESETALEYGLRDRASLGAYAHLSSLPFQAQIAFTTPSGMRALRVLTQSQAVTTERAVAERDVKVELVSAQIASKSAALARDGRYKEARCHWIAASPMLNRAAQTPAQRQTFQNYAQEIDVFDRTIAQQQRMEEQAGGGRSDDDEEGEGAADRAAAGAGGLPPRPSASSAGARKKSKKVALSDESYRVIHKTHQLNSAGLI